ncbi:hypothetical protein [Actinomadura kijaniata]|uniref:hypothetical protein n=1 Tax=Actinomadura kijaniata TaxID=46161 RepID=UPI00082F87BF|nr:hypothetical protein [Actinomadura kijaniata]
MHASSPSPSRNRPRRLVPGLVLGALVLGVAGVGLAGGFAGTPPQPDKPAGKPIDVGAFEVTVRDTLVTTDRFDRNQRFLAVRMRVVNKGRESAALGAGGLRFGLVGRTRDGRWVNPDDVEAVAAGSKIYEVHPGLPVEATAKWRMGPADAPGRFVLGLREWEYGPGFTDTDIRWRADTEDDRLAARVTLAVTGS